jgi:O-antigen ligase
MIAASFTFFAALKPVEALLVVAAFLPIARTICAAFGVQLAWTEPLVLAWLAGSVLALGIGRLRWELAPRLAFAVLFFAAAVVASLAVNLSVLAMTMEDFGGRLWTYLAADYLDDPRGFPAIGASALLIEGTALFGMTCLAVRNGKTWSRVAAMFALGGVAAAVLNVYRLLEVTIRAGFTWGRLVELFQQARINILHADVNAAGSYFVLVLFLALGLARGGTRLAPAWYAGAGIVAGALWLTGSRAALVAAALVAIAALIGLAGERHAARTKTPGALVAILVIVSVAALVYVANPGRFRPATTGTAIGIRWEMAKVTWQMLETRPLFGIGAGEFYARSTEFASPELRSQYVRENAHNNFFQIFAELGLVGGVGFVWLLAQGVGPVRGREDANGPSVQGLRLGIIAFLVTCLSGHPLLVRDVAYPFWIGLGLLAAGRVTREGGVERAMSPSPARHGSLSQQVRWAGVLVAGLILSVPFRAAYERSHANLAETAFGVSDWYRSEDGRWVRDVRGLATVFVPQGSRFLVVPLQWSGGSGPITIDFRFDGRQADRIRVEPDRWHDVRFLVPDSADVRFHRIDIVIGPAEPGAGGRIRMGRLVYSAGAGGSPLTDR